MKEVLKKKIKSISIILCILLLVITGIGPGIGIGSIFSIGSSGDAIGSVGSKEIKLSEFNDIYMRKVEHVARVFNGKLTHDMVKSMGLAKMALDELIDMKILDNFVSELELDLGLESVADFIRSKGFFKGEKGEFNKIAFQEHLKEHGMTEKQFYELIKADILRHMVVKSIRSNLPAPEWLMKNMYENKYKSRIVDVITVFPPDARTVGEPVTDDLEDLYEQYKYELKTPEYRNVDYIRICTEDVVNLNLSDLEVTHEELSEAINSSDYADLWNRRDAINLVLSDKDEAFKAKSDFESGKNYDDIIKKYGNDVESVKLKNIGKYDLQSELRVIFDMKVGDVTVVKSNLGWHVVKLEKAYKASSEEVEKIRESVREQLVVEKKVIALRDIVKKMEEDISHSNLTVRDLASKYEFEYVPLDSVDINGYDENRNIFAIPSDIRYSVLSESFTRNVHDQGEFFPNLTGTCYGNVYVKGIKESEIMSFSQAKDILKNMWVQKKRKESSLAYVNEIIANIGESNDVNSISKMNNVMLERDKVVYDISVASEVNPSQRISSALVGKIFSTDVGKLTEVVDERDAMLIAKVNKVDKAPSIEENKDVYRRMKSKFQDIRSTVVYESIISALKEEYGVHIKPEFIAKIEGI